MLKINLIRKNSHPAITAWVAIAFLLLTNSAAPLKAINPEACNDYIAHKTSEIPEFDGLDEDEFWANCPWYAIDQVWLPYNNELNYPDATKEGSSTLIKDENDFSGKFKLAWNEEENMLYLLAVITDNVFVGGYAGAGNYSGYDVLEIFVDEDAAGGPHEYDIEDESIAADAFAYHVNATPYDDRVQTMCNAIDLAGNPAKVKEADYRNHFPHFALRKEGNTYTYELAMKLYKAKIGVAYETSEANDYEATLFETKKIGFSLAYCDNDKPGVYTRDHFIGSSYLPAGKNNSNYQTSDRFGKLTLAGEYISIEDDVETSCSLITIYPNPIRDFAIISFAEEVSLADISLISLDGRLLRHLYNGNAVDQTLKLPLSDITQGIYLLKVNTNKGTSLAKIIKK